MDITLRLHLLVLELELAQPQLLELKGQNMLNQDMKMFMMSLDKELHQESSNIMNHREMSTQLITLSELDNMTLCWTPKFLHLKESKGKEDELVKHNIEREKDIMSPKLQEATIKELIAMKEPMKDLLEMNMLDLNSQDKMRDLMLQGD